MCLDDGWCLRGVDQGRSELAGMIYTQGRLKETFLCMIERSPASFCSGRLQRCGFLLNLVSMYARGGERSASLQLEGQWCDTCLEGQRRCNSRHNRSREMMVARYVPTSKNTQNVVKVKALLPFPVLDDVRDLAVSADQAARSMCGRRALMRMAGALSLRRCWLHLTFLLSSLRPACNNRDYMYALLATATLRYYR